MGNNNQNRMVDISNISKFNAYRTVADDFVAAEEIMKNKKLAYGEPAVVPFYYPNKDDENRLVKLMFGIGSIDGNVEIFSNFLYYVNSDINNG